LTLTFSPTMQDRNTTVLPTPQPLGLSTMSSDDVKIHHVSDTAIWVAHYRAVESERPDALFRDDLAGVLAGPRGREIADSVRRPSPFSQWSVVIRTVLIDGIIQKLVSDGVDMVINLGAGLDTRPYRMNLPETLHWVEVDYANIIDHKHRLLRSEKPGVNLERIVLDLSDIEQRRELFSRLNAKAQNTLVLTEGVVPYLKEDQVASLAKDLHAQKNIHWWIAEYYSPQIYFHFKTRQRRVQMKNAPFCFFPANWFDFFRAYGWEPSDVRYLPEEAQKLGRRMPLPWWARWLLRCASKERASKHLKLVGYVIFTKTNPLSLHCEGGGV
jgi:methyltransferase (TIGR00027 family)